ncbi:putative transmembrane anti-sigma factor [Chthoniobacter flavus Ellin428]|uniref:Putative transmembrane anti-sigma factor n=1 Tax=Chthoniobacter flavus Ellin428 TaxID=497964 RepID=B4D562_9BACT|nr:anti-sigma factor [Chthoniobacter flavus]EDY18267.1 putative transmembrane anti-sigma factor [Chthoniobacter flavus Ellin428]TCO91296.1 anti-sigma factor RsiW [Chthoniobacter flavus]
MNCEQVQKLIHAHHDGELDVANTLQVDEHLADCPSCFNAVRQLSALRGALQDSELRFRAPTRLRSSITAAVEQAVRAERPAVITRPWYRQPAWSVAAVLLVACVLTLQVSFRRSDDRLLAELTSSHVRSLMVNHLYDVASTDQHTVKPWFDGKIDFAPPVKDLRETGFPLLGGRMDFLEGRAVAALVYGRQKHFLNLFVWPSASSSPAELRATQRNGYNVLRWSDGKMNFGLVSDLNEGEMREFVREWAAK